MFSRMASALGGDPELDDWDDEEDPDDFSDDQWEDDDDDDDGPEDEYIAGRTTSGRGKRKQKVNSNEKQRFFPF
jgi:hypothetical protein